ncbi:MAG: STAS domain-containing protein [Gammaproteobacteria bacterium]|nr:STAS domain-containing protein [Gammaproteobacteria bacterium]
MGEVELQAGVLRLGGVLDHDSTPQLRVRAGQLLQGAAAGQILIDCSAVTRSNSAGLALILAIMRDAQALGKQYSVAPLPKDMRQMAHVCELAEVLQPAQHTQDKR